MTIDMISKVSFKFNDQKVSENKNDVQTKLDNLTGKILEQKMQTEKEKSDIVEAEQINL